MKISESPPASAFFRWARRAAGRASPHRRGRRTCGLPPLAPPRKTRTTPLLRQRQGRIFSSSELISVRCFLIRRARARATTSHANSHLPLLITKTKMHARGAPPAPRHGLVSHIRPHTPLLLHLRPKRARTTNTTAQPATTTAGSDETSRPRTPCTPRLQASGWGCR